MKNRKLIEMSRTWIIFIRGLDDLLSYSMSFDSGFLFFLKKKLGELSRLIIFFPFCKQIIYKRFD